MVCVLTDWANISRTGKRSYDYASHGILPGSRRRASPGRHVHDVGLLISISISPKVGEWEVGRNDRAMDAPAYMTSN